MKDKPFRVVFLVAFLLVYHGPVSIFAQTNFTLLKSFSVSGGSQPLSQLYLGRDNVLYGTTSLGGSANAGTIFRVNLDGSGYTTLKEFLGSDGSQPLAGVIQGRDGSLYGTTCTGGAYNLGTVFRLRSSGTFTILHSFSGDADGQNPRAALIQASDGLLYGTTYTGSSSNRGTIFSVRTNGNSYSVLHIFTGYPDGQQCESKLLEGSDGALYGTTSLGGFWILGTIFRLDKDGGNYAILHYFSNAGGEGRSPVAGLIEGSDGSLYGTTYNGGITNHGTLFTMSKDGNSYAILRSFSSADGGGKWPDTELVEGSDGMLYGATEQGGINDRGVIFKMNKDGTGYAALRNFANTGSDGRAPKSALTPTTNGVIYGTTQFGGEADAGCIFALSSAALPARILTFTRSTGSNSFQFTGTSFAQYDLQRSTNLISWSTLSTLTTTTNGSFKFTDPSPPAGPGFYRIPPH